MEGLNDFCRTGCVNSESMWTMLLARNKVALATTFEPCSCANNRTKCKKAWFVCLIARSFSHSSLLLDIYIYSFIFSSSFLLYFHVLGLTIVVVVVVVCWFSKNRTLQEVYKFKYISWTWRTFHPSSQMHEGFLVAVIYKISSIDSTCHLCHKVIFFTFGIKVNGANH